MTGGAGGGADPGAGLGWRWDVALSFAGAQRDYVEKVAAVLKARGVRCFYDANEQIELWGKYLAEELPAIYGEQAATVVVFVSADYAARDWTRLERRAALNRAVQERGEYVLPARFDETPLPGLLSDMVAIDLRTRTPEQFAALVADKLAALNVTALAPPAAAGEGAPTGELSRPADVVRVREVDPRRLGVHAAISVPGVPDEVPPEYVPRDADPTLGHLSTLVLQRYPHVGGGGVSPLHPRRLDHFENTVKAPVPIPWLSPHVSSQTYELLIETSVRDRATWPDVRVRDGTAAAPMWGFHASYRRSFDDLSARDVVLFFDKTGTVWAAGRVAVPFVSPGAAKELVKQGRWEPYNGRGFPLMLTFSQTRINLRIPLGRVGSIIDQDLSETPSPAFFRLSPAKAETLEEFLREQTVSVSAPQARLF
jgi:hypothetical protein